MSKRIKNIEYIQRLLEESLKITKKMLLYAKEIDDKFLKNLLFQAVIVFSTITMTSLIQISKHAPKLFKKDDIDKEFNKLMKPLEDEWKDRQK